VVGVTTLSTVAMVMYPLLTAWLGFDAATSGQFIGATIHDVAQVVGAGYSLSPQAGDASTLTKLMRVAYLMPVLLVISLVLRSRAARGGSMQAPQAPLLPWFVLVFTVLMLINSTGWVPAFVQKGASDLSQIFLVLAIAAVGLKTSLKDVTQLGWRPVLLMVLVTLGLAAITAAYLLAVK
jgi:uncharacterized integral membrane protein (TIGR00698 family)